MSWFSKVVWSEGLFLRPQHFQQQDRHAEWRNEVYRMHLHANGWGFARLDVDDAGLAIGKVVIRRASGILPDGTPFDFPAAHEGPVAFDFPSEVKDALVVLALPLQRPFMPEYDISGDDDSLARFVVTDVTLPDTAAEGGGAEVVQLGRPRLCLGLSDDFSDAFVRIGVVRITERRPDGSLLVDRGYIPSVLACDAAPQLSSMLREIVGLLGQRMEALAGRMVQAGNGGVAEMADFLFLLAVNRHLPVFSHLEQLRPLHPERLYSQMLTLMGELSTLTAGDRRPPTLQAYRHDALQDSFEFPMREIRRSLSAILEQNALQIPLQDHQQGRYVGIIADRGLLKQAGFVLAVGAQMPAEAVRTRFPTQAKLGPVEKIRELVNLQLPGIALRPLPVAPRQIPFHAGYTYFELDNSGDLWKQLDASGGLGMYVTGDFPGLDVALWAIRG
ncbi:type VI secretion system baseplate subunit TssK [Parazoarcus communis]|uniref:Type VI secretion system baseplate subunit TssK n=1 Tax=Parazoarcus communis SWub3 = DSM 12120 TaxID=1121029 RepID=A0A323UVQ7_9RHOO|nr:type VI secretion system baseplate subunit TssK [Parazoarcus communis]NMG71634.1 type VI secretion system baseplate subunit TssK [Parazoarcus communis SWub3 = DSM 12120]PZA15316.1 type VI secretion system baseplate subunit TssK [Azoarcus communis] [Parazoarcus communis SWub3 = DSM 12120]